MARCLLKLSLVVVCSLDTGLGSEPPRLPLCLDEAECPASAGGLSLLQTQAGQATGNGLRSGGARSGLSSAAQSRGGRPQLPSPCSAEDLAAKDVDVVVYGATGFTGKRAAAYLSEGHPQQPRWAIGGHSAAKLEELRQTLATSPAPPQAVLEADLEDAEGLRAMTRRAKVVVTFVGPYERYNGGNLISAAVDTCTHYVDISGEPIWKAQMLSTFGAAAKARGVAIVQSAGLDSLPADFVSLWSARRLAADGEGPPTDVTVYYSKLNAAVSGGTIESGKDGAKAGMNIKDRAHAYALSPETPPESQVDESPGGAAPHTFGTALFGYDANFSSFTVPHYMSMIDGPVMRRSLGLTFQGAPIRVAEVAGQGLFSEYASFINDPRMATEPLNMHPKQGEGPPEWVLEKGGLLVKGLSVRGAPHTARSLVTMECQGEPGYALTPKWALEVSLGLAEAGPVDGQAGYLTPALVFAPEALAERLRRTNCSFELDV